MSLITTLAVLGAIGSSKAQPSIPANPVVGTRYAVIAGCILPKYDTLNFTVVDANMMYERLGLGGAERKLLTSNSNDPALKPTKQNVIEAVREYAEKCGPEDTFWFYWSGHGTKFEDTSYLLSYDSAPGDFRTMIDVTELRKIVSNCKARAKVLILDSCFSGSYKAIGANTWEQLLGSYSGTVTMAAAKIDQPAIESVELGHGIFTFFLVRGLAGAAAGNDDVVTLGELEKYVVKNVKSFAERTPGQTQDPQFIYDRGQGNEPVSQGTTAEAETMPVPDTATSRPRPPLSPGVVLLISATNSALSASVQGKLRKRLIDDRFPTVSDEQAHAFQQLLSEPNVSSDVLARWRSRYLLRGSLQVDAAPLGGDLRGLYDAHVTLTIELIDAEGNVANTFDSNTNGKAVRAADTSALGATEKAINTAVDVVYGRIRGKLERRFAG